VSKSLDKQFGRFLRQQRADASYAQFARKLGISLALFSTQFTKPLLDGAKADYLVGTYDGTTFHPETEMQFPEIHPEGRSLYAPQTWRTEIDGKPAVIQMGFLHHEKGPLLTWNNQMAFPVELTLHQTPDGPRLYREPFGIAKLRTDAKTWKDLVVKSGDNPLAEVRGDVLEIRAEIDLSAAKGFTLGVRGKTIGYAAGGKIEFDGLKVEAPASVSRVALQMLVDRSSIELFLDRGRASISRSLFFDPARQDFSLTSDGGEVRVVSMEVNRLKPVWAAHPLQPRAFGTPVEPEWRHPQKHIPSSKATK